MSSLSVKKLLSKKSKAPSYEMFGQDWEIRSIPVYELDSLMQEAREGGRIEAEKTLEGQRAKLEAEPINEKEWEASIAQVENPKDLGEKPENRYEQILNRRTNTLFFTALAWELLKDQDGNLLKDYREAATDEEREELEETINEDFGLFMFLSTFISEKTASVRKVPKNGFRRSKN